MTQCYITVGQITQKMLQISHSAETSKYIYDYYPCYNSVCVCGAVF